jgi:hypothetical protein
VPLNSLGASGSSTMIPSVASAFGLPPPPTPHGTPQHPPESSESDGTVTSPPSPPNPDDPLPPFPFGHDDRKSPDSAD